MSKNYNFYIQEGIKNLNNSRFDVAKKNFIKAMEININDNILSFLAISYLELKDYEKGISFLEKSLKLNSKNEISNSNLPFAYLNYGLSLINENIYKKGIEYLNKALKVDNRNPLILFNLGKLYYDNNDLKKSLDFLSQAISIDPSSFISHNLIGLIYKKLSNKEMAEQFFKTALDINPNYQDALLNLANLYSDNKNYNLALNLYSNLIKMDHIKFSFLHGEILDLKKRQCDWSEYYDHLELIEKVLLSSSNYIHHLSFLSHSDNLELIQKNAHIYQHLNSSSYRTNITFKKNKNKNKKKKIGYFSSDFREHAVGRLVTTLFKNHDREKFEVYGFFASILNGDIIEHKILNSFDSYFEISAISDEEVLNLLDEINLDIAIDMMGFTKNSRSNLFNNRIAPVQINFLGYLSTLGSKSYDYIIADENVIKECDEFYYDEKIIRLPLYTPNDIQNIRINKKSRADFNLPEKSFIYCYLGNNNKITPKIFNAWINILTNTTNSYLLLLVENILCQQNIINYIKKLDFDSSRIIFTEKTSYADYLSKLSLCDLFLDTNPYNAGSTAIDCFAAGLPILTFSGNSYVSRMCGSQLKSLNLDSLVTYSIEEYISRAIELSTSGKIEFDVKSSKNFNIQNYVKNLEEAFTISISQANNKKSINISNF
jgi:protein O-GlcNAc transferase